MGTHKNVVHPNLNFHFHLPLVHLHGLHHEKREPRDIPKGFMAVLVGRGEEQERFVIPVAYVNHPLFLQLLKEAEEEFGFDQKGPITIPCRIDEFRNIQDSIDRENLALHHQHHHHNHGRCFI